VGRISESELPDSGREFSGTEPVRLDDQSLLDVVQAAERSAASDSFPSQP
jgi:hypothetical protein